MCVTGAPGTTYTKCGHKVEGVEKVIRCKDYPNGRNCVKPPFSQSLTGNKVKMWCPNCVAEGKGTN